ncbi:MAG: YifB family Mg chelatase-like AAA ATPase [Pseudomonadota bacterium]
MVAQIITFAFQGIQVTEVEVQAHIASGLPAFNIVGLPDKTVAESKERIRAAFSSIALALPAKRITINLAPADLFKEGSHYDLPIALGILVAMEIIPQDIVSNFLVAGELALNGSIMNVNGILPAAIYANDNNNGIICPDSNGAEACWAGEMPIISTTSLLELINHFKGHQIIDSPKKPEISQNKPPYYNDLEDIKGQKMAKRALEIAAAGAHNMLMIGPPGSGKSMLASCLPGLIPTMDSQEILETSMIKSVSGQIKKGLISQYRAFRAPHHSCSMAAMIGGGRNAKPGEISLAHAGVLFLDELPEYNRSVLDSLRQPVENGYVTVARANAHVTYPANFQLIAAMNPCKCGYLSDADRACNKAPICSKQYLNKISGPLIDRFDMVIEVGAVDFLSHDIETQSENSATVKQRIMHARQKQESRYQHNTVKVNSEVSGEILLNSCNMDDECKKFIKDAAQKLNLSMRGYHRILRVSRTIADLENAPNVGISQIKETLAYRMPVI